MAELNRREFVGSVCKSLGVVVAGAMLLDTSLLKTIIAAPRAGNDTNQTLEVKISEHDDLKTVGGAVVLMVEAIGQNIILARTGDASFDALTATCTHKHCVVGYDGDYKMFVCPCHNSQYGLDGSVMQGPAQQPLQQFPTTFANDVVTVWLSGKPAADSNAVATPTPKDSTQKDPSPADTTKK